jgi:3-phenylpropionate/trans-cinnamate dioxygenase ferredoxin reductase subunit
MIRTEYLIIGAGVAGVSAAEAIRRNDTKGRLIMAGTDLAGVVDRESLIPFLNTGPRILPSSLVTTPAEPWCAEHGVELRADSPVVQFNAERRVAVFASGQAVEFKKALLATGSRARRVKVPGSGLGNIFYPRTMRDIVGLRETLGQISHVTVVGGGWGAIEAASTLRDAGKEVALLTRSPAVFGRFLDPDTGAWLNDLFSKRGVRLYLNEILNGFEGQNILQRVQTKSGLRIDTDAVVVFMGAEPNLSLVANTPLNGSFGCPVNEYLETEEPAVFAAGDVAFYQDKRFGGSRRVEHVDAARAQGALAGHNMSSRSRKVFDYVPWHRCTVFGSRFDFVGDFSKQPTRSRCEGSLAKRRFTLLLQFVSRVTGIVLCNQPEEEVERVRSSFNKSLALDPTSSHLAAAG